MLLAELQSWDLFLEDEASFLNQLIDGLGSAGAAG